MLDPDFCDLYEKIAGFAAGHIKWCDSISSYPSDMRIKALEALMQKK
jgi:hypothetical protein